MMRLEDGSVMNLNRDDIQYFYDKINNMYYYSKLTANIL